VGDRRHQGSEPVRTTLWNDAVTAGIYDWRNGVVILRSNNHQDRMSALGQKQTFRDLGPMSALPPKADLVQHGRDVRFVPKADSCIAAKHIEVVCKSTETIRWARKAKLNEGQDAAA